MKDELQSKLVEVLTSIQNASAQAADFTMEHLPDIAQSYVVYGMVSSIAWAGVGIITFISMWLLIVRLERDRDYITSGTFYVCGGMISLVPLVAGLVNLQSALLVWFAPKAWLLKEIASMVGK